jgi:uncharacterized protein (TIGR00645 family)
MDEGQAAFNQVRLRAAKAIATELESRIEAISRDVVEAVAAQLKTDAAGDLSSNLSREIREHLASGAPDSIPKEPAIEKFLFQSRWLMAIPYFLLIGVMAGLVYLVFMHTVHFWIGIVNGSRDSIAQLVDILDLMLIGSLLVMVMIGGYENTISKISKDRNVGPSWVGNLEISHLKIKVAASIVLISGVHLLKIFLAIKTDQPTDKFDFNIFWSLVIHIVFILSVLLLAYVDKILHDADYRDN